MPRLSEVLFRGSEQSFANFAVLPSNIQAVEAALLFANGLQAFVGIVGPSGWGKTHLLEAASRRMREEAGVRGCEPINALDWVTGARGNSQSTPLILDNVQDILEKTRVRLAFRLALERRVKAGWPTLLSFTAPKPTRQIKGSLPHGRDWTLAVVKPAGVAERELLVSQIAAAEGLALGDGLKKILSTKLDGDGRTLTGALKRLKLNQARWVDAHATLRACGLLTPFFAASPSWDLREHILEAAKAMSPRERADVDHKDLATYAMLRVAQLGEADVARYLEVEPARAYLNATRVEESVRGSETLATVERRFIERVVDGLQNT